MHDKCVEYEAAFAIYERLRMDVQGLVEQREAMTALIENLRVQKQTAFETCQALKQVIIEL
jgi:hypothetical protein